MYIVSMEQQILKKFLIFNIIAFNERTAISRNSEQDTYHRQSMCY